MNQTRLAIHGGTPIIQKKFEPYSTIGVEEQIEVNKILKSGNLSAFLGKPGEGFYGGEKVQEFEQRFAEKFKVEYAIVLNSWTSGLWCAVGALNLKRGSEVITSSWTMAASATVLLHWGLVPVFVDISEDTFNLDSKNVLAAINEKTSAILSPDIFGLCAPNEILREICDRYDLRFISDSAQAPLAQDSSKNLSSTLSDIGGFSLNYHKHIHTGEGGVVVTSNFELAERVRMLRNHGEIAVGFGNSIQRKQNAIMGMNLRMGEIEASIGICQLSKLDWAVSSRREASLHLIEGLRKLPGLVPPKIPLNMVHSFYVLGLRLDYNNLPKHLSRDKIVKALQHEGVPALMTGYQNIHKLPIFNSELVRDESNYPYNLLSTDRSKEVQSPILPVAEDLHLNSFIGVNMCAHTFTSTEIKLMLDAFSKVWQNLDIL